MGVQMRGQPLAGGGQRRRGSRRHREDLRRARRGRGHGGRGFLQDDVAVGAADAERGDAGPPRRRRPAQSRRRSFTKNGLAAKSICGLGVRKCRVGGSCPWCSDSTVLIRPAMPAASSRWPMLVLTEPIAQKPVRAVECRNAWVSAAISIGIADRRAGAVRLDVGDAVGGDAADGQRLGNRRRLAVDAGREVADLARAVVVHGRALDDRVDAIAVGRRVGEPPQHDDAGAAAEERPGGGGVEGPAMAVGRQDLAPLVEVAAVLRQLDRAAAGQRHVALPAEQALRRQVHGDERRRAGRLHVDARPGQVQLVGQPRREEVLVVAGVAQQPLADRVHEAPVGDQVVHHVGVQAAGGEDADLAAQPVRIVPGVLERFPADFQEEAVLGVHDRRVLRRDPKNPASKRSASSSTGRALT